MVLVPSDERRVPRVGPKVFADVPSASEVQAVKRSRGQIFAFALIVIGLLVAAVAFVLFLLDEQKKLQARIEPLETQVAELTAENTSLDAQLGDYQTIANLRRQAGDLRRTVQAEIDRYAADFPGDAGPRGALQKGREEGFLAGESWNRTEPNVRQRLNLEIEQLTIDAQRAEAWNPPRVPRTASTAGETTRRAGD